MDGRTSEAHEVAEWIGEYAADLVGIPDLHPADGEDIDEGERTRQLLAALSTGQRTLLETAAHTVLQLRRVDAFIAAMPSIVHTKRRQLYPVIVQRTSLVNTLKALLTELGLERRAKQVPDLDIYLSTPSTDATTTAAPSAAGSSPTAAGGPSTEETA
jgi:hypothetical protein